MNKRTIWLALFVLIAGCTVSATAQALQSGTPGFGQQWLREHPFSIQADSLYPATWDFDEYFAAGMTLLTKGFSYQHVISPINRPSEYADAPWQAFLPVPTGNPQAGINEFNNLRQTSHNIGWIVGDEPNRLRMADYAAVVSHIRQEDPSQIVYSTLKNNNGVAEHYYGDTSRPDYTYSDYVDDFISIIQPDVLVYDYYPFRTDGTTDSKYIENLMVIRDKAQANGLPYWAWMQAWGKSNSRFPSESDNRFNVYTHLTAGYTGLLYWTYDYYGGTGDGLIDIHGDPTPLYHSAAQTNIETFNLGRSLRFLASTDVRFVPGRHVVFGPITAPNTTPQGLTSWKSGAGADPYVQSVTVDTSQPENIGLEKNGLIGFFTDDEGNHYFMLTNLNHGTDLSAAETSVDFTIIFDSSVDSLWLLNRTTGLTEEVLLSNHVLNWTLLGGTGDLFKYGNDDFAGLVPEPTTGVGILAGLMLAAARRPLRNSSRSNHVADYFVAPLLNPRLVVPKEIKP